MGTSAIVMMCVGIVAIWGGLAINLYISINLNWLPFTVVSLNFATTSSFCGSFTA